MNESPPALASNVRGWWTVWIIVVVGGPLLRLGLLVTGMITENTARTSGSMTLVVYLLVLLVSLILHATASIVLARRLAAKREPDRRTGAAIGLAIGLLVGGWVIMASVFFFGCLAGMTAANSTSMFR